MNQTKRTCKTTAKSLLIALFALTTLAACTSREPDYLEQSLQLAGENRGELEKVLEHYKDNPHKLAAARFLIENMPAHYSYKGDGIDGYYRDARGVFRTGLSPKQQADSTAYLAAVAYPELEADTISDVRVATAEFLISNIDKAFTEWETRPWAAHLTFEQFCEWLLPYKVVNLQSLDGWRDTLSSYFTWGLNNMVHDDDTYETTINAANTIRNEINWRIKPFGIYYSAKGYPFLSASTMPYFTFGNCRDYVTLAVSTFRSVGIPAVIDETPYWGRYRAGHWVHAAQQPWRGADFRMGHLFHSRRLVLYGQAHSQGVPQHLCHQPRAGTVSEHLGLQAPV